MTAANHFLLAGGVSVEDRSNRAETVRPEHDAHCERQFVWDTAQSDVHDIELHGKRAERLDFMTGVRR